MVKIKLTKSELKNQRDSLKQFKRYLPTLQLKKQQLQMKIREVKYHLSEKVSVLNKKMDSIKQWDGLLADNQIDLEKWTSPVDIILSSQNIAGAKVPVFEDIKFDEAQYDLYSTPFWVDRAIKELREMISMSAEVDVIRKQINILEGELRATTQRVNLFEKVKIPECSDNIRKIRIYLGDQQANAVGVSKVAKKKVEERDSLILKP